MTAMASNPGQLIPEDALVVPLLTAVPERSQSPLAHCTDRNAW